jgi:hypothetical protein
MATERPETIDAASACGPKRSGGCRRATFWSREEWAKPRGRKLNAGFAARRSRRSRCSARSSHRGDPNGACSRNRESQGEPANVTDTEPHDTATRKSLSLLKIKCPQGPTTKAGAFCGAGAYRHGMVTVLSAIVSIFAFRFRSRAALELKLIAVQHQLAVLHRQRPGRPQLSSLDRLLWVWLYQIWPQVIDTMVVGAFDFIGAGDHAVRAGPGYPPRMSGSRDHLQRASLAPRGVELFSISSRREDASVSSQGLSTASSAVQLPSAGNNIIAFPQVGGLHHRYERQAA